MDKRICVLAYRWSCEKRMFPHVTEGSIWGHQSPFTQQIYHHRKELTGRSNLLNRQIYLPFAPDPKQMLENN